MNAAREPISISAALTLVLTSGVALVAIFVPGLSQAAQVAIIGFGNALIILGTVIYARPRSTSTAYPVLPAGKSVTTPDGAPATVVLTEPINTGSIS